MEVAGAEKTHGINHLRTAGKIRSTFENLVESANGEDFEIEEMYPEFIREAEGESQMDAVATFELALQREKHHRAMFKEAFESFRKTQVAKA
jgi:rubrerythrin